MTMPAEPRGRRKPGAKKVMRRAGKSPEIRCLLIPTDGETMLLPITTMAEMVDISLLQTMDDAPPWLLGQVEWESRQVPVFAFSALINGKDLEPISSRSKIMIIKSLSESARMPFLGLLLGGVPRPVEVQENALVEKGDEKKSLGVYRRVTFGEQDAIIPDLDRLTHLVTHATLGALPITQLDEY